MKKLKPKEIIPVYEKQPLHWLILKGRRKLIPIPYTWVMPDLKYFKKVK